MSLTFLLTVANGVKLLRPHAFLRQTFFAETNVLFWQMHCDGLADLLALLVLIFCSFDFCGICVACFVLLLGATVQFRYTLSYIKNRFHDLIFLDYFYDVNLLLSDKQSFFMLVCRGFRKRFRHSYPCFCFFDCSSLTRAHCRDL